jgi:DEAD/DEAH box helicase domain-containing protein
VDLAASVLPEIVVPERPPRKHGITRGMGDATPLPPSLAPIAAADPDRLETRQILIFDLETQRSADDVGGWGASRRWGWRLRWSTTSASAPSERTSKPTSIGSCSISLSPTGSWVSTSTASISPCSPATPTAILGRIRTLDLLGEIHKIVGFRVSLNHLSEINLGESKAGDGLQSLRWWKEGRIDLIEHYCRKDVEVTRRLWELGRSRGYLLHRDKEGRTLRIPAVWP